MKSAWAGITKRRSFFYRPEFVENPKLWQDVRMGYEIEVPEIIDLTSQIKAKEEAE